MSARLAAASALIKGPLVTRWLEVVDGSVCASLGALIDDPPAVASATAGRMPIAPAGYRRAMAVKHARLVDLLVERKGEAVIGEARRSMHSAGVDLGERLRTQLRLSDGEDDLIGAARLLYRLLGIEFEVVRDGERTVLLVRRCSLSAGGYSPLTCEVMSAMDEGVVVGLRPGAVMRFIRKNTDQEHKCEAELVLEGRK